MNYRENIEDWKRLYLATVGYLLSQGIDGEKFVIGLLLTFINRRPAKRELIEDIINSTHSLEVFGLLNYALDEPGDRY